MSLVDLRQGDARIVLASLPDKSVQMVCTSPPYFNLRSYDTGHWEGGDASCDHKLLTRHQQQGKNSLRKGRSNVEHQRNENFRSLCGKCGARRIDHQSGLEPTVDEYVEQLVGIFGEIRRVLVNDGTVWLNIGDSYANDGKWGGSTSGKHVNKLHGDTSIGRTRCFTGAKAKDLLLVPARVALALQADGWYLRSEIVWAKPNPVPESVKDRPSCAHEKVFLFSKQPRYYYDANAVAETAVGTRKRGPALHPDLISTNGNAGLARRPLSETRNLRNVWTITPKPYKGAHFAVMPLDMAEICIRAGSRPGDVVLDPFGGAGTTAIAAIQLDRRAVLIELNPDYIALAEARIAVAERGKALNDLLGI